ncbi:MULTISPECIES: hypothetical protein [unclassified Tabrizicola]|uniref:hypothetical protein n=1 Tax=unclassified Tabrizicola TaxID=2620214 RepID=UPI00157188EC|nr:hypothetical protein [Tabrizicola sp. SY72]NTT88528.1 hypothetical protein [Tabrizicola sp. SY72]
MPLDLDRSGVRARIQHLAFLQGGTKPCAEKCAVPVPSLETWLAGRALPGSVALAKLARGCDVSAHWILFGQEATRHG